MRGLKYYCVLRASKKNPTEGMKRMSRSPSLLNDTCVCMRMNRDKHFGVMSLLL